ncbi:MAG: hypothetical protein J5I94_11440 [Phaeodactylibacter sp.]|nr:hypothetical protein [Phaeodactylibacter sp.]
MDHKLKLLLSFGGKLFLYYIGLMILTLATGFAVLFLNWHCGCAEALWGDASVVAQINCVGQKAGKDTYDAEVEYRLIDKAELERLTEQARRTGQANVQLDVFGWSYNFMRIEFFPLLFLISLILAYPASWRYRLKSLLIALLLFIPLSFILLYAKFLYQMHLDTTVFSHYQLPGFWASFMRYLSLSLAEARFIFILLLWGVVMVRWEDVRAMV